MDRISEQHKPMMITLTDVCFIFQRAINAIIFETSPKAQDVIKAVQIKCSSSFPIVGGGWGGWGGSSDVVVPNDMFGSIACFAVEVFIRSTNTLCLSP